MPADTEEVVYCGRRWKPGIPRSGWTFLEIIDLGQPDHTCEMCGQEDIRYVHRLTHPCHRILEVGCVCAGHMQGDVKAARDRERKLKNLVRRKEAERKKWDDLANWRRNEKGNYFRRYRGKTATLFKWNDTWRAVVTIGDQQTWLECRHRSPEFAAKEVGAHVYGSSICSIKSRLAALRELLKGKHP